MNALLPAVNAAPPEKDDPTIWRVDDALWARLEPLLRSTKARKKSGRPRRDDRALFDGLIWLARTGAQWSQLPREFGPKSTVHERFSEWVETGASWQAADGCIVKAPFGKKGVRARRRPRGATPPIVANPAPNGTC